MNDPLQQLITKKGGGRIFKGGCIFERLRYIITETRIWGGEKVPVGNSLNVHAYLQLLQPSPSRVGAIYIQAARCHRISELVAMPRPN